MQCIDVCALDAPSSPNTSRMRCAPYCNDAFLLHATESNASECLMHNKRIKRAIAFRIHYRHFSKMLRKGRTKTHGPTFSVIHLHFAIFWTSLDYTYLLPAFLCFGEHTLYWCTLCNNRVTETSVC